ERDLVVVVVHRCAGIHANIEGLVPRQDDRNRVRNFLIGYLIAIDLKDPGSTFAEAGPIVSEIEYDSVFTWRQGVLAVPAEPLHVNEVVKKHRFALENV